MLISAGTDGSLVADDVVREACAWAYWLQWRGGTDLVYRIARAAIWAAREAHVEQPLVRIDVLVQGDKESFESPEDFRDNVTRDALRRFDRIVVAVEARDSSVAISASMVRTKQTTPLSAPDELANGVHLRVRTDPSWSEEQRLAIRRAVVGAIDRGAATRQRRGAGGAAALSGDSTRDGEASPAIERLLHPPPSPPRRLSSWRMAMLTLLVGTGIVLASLVFFEPAWFNGVLTAHDTGSSFLAKWLGSIFGLGHVSAGHPYTLNLPIDGVVFAGFLMAWQLFANTEDAPPTPAVSIVGIHRSTPIKTLCGKIGDHALSVVITLLLTYPLLHLLGITTH